MPSAMARAFFTLNDVVDTVLAGATEQDIKELEWQAESRLRSMDPEKARCIKAMLRAYTRARFYGAEA